MTVAVCVSRAGIVMYSSGVLPSDDAGPWLWLWLGGSLDGAWFWAAIGGVGWAEVEDMGRGELLIWWWSLQRKKRTRKDLLTLPYPCPYIN